MARAGEPSPSNVRELSPSLVEVASQLFVSAEREPDAMLFLGQALERMSQTLGGLRVLVAQGAKGQWRTLAAAGIEGALPVQSMAEALDRDEALFAGDWYVAPLNSSGASGEVFAIHTGTSGAEARGGSHHRTFETLAQWLAAALSQVRARQRDRQQIERLATILEIAADWQQSHAMDKLLAKMAEASTKLLGAERASIFLWDRAARTLVGRPALGVPEGELRVPDDAGIVGQVVQSGQPRRVDADIAEEQRGIDRRIDRRLKFQTRSLVCVPLRSLRGEVLGAFEVINKRGGNFSADDEATLGELARHAAAALANTERREQLVAAQHQMAEQAEQGVRLIGQCPAIVALRSTVERLADTELAVLVLGENGTGKEVVAQMIHYRSRRRSEPLIAVNCAALTETLLESELFGHEKGAFTDAREMRRGKFELAARGTLFLDEIGDMSLAGQAKLLRVLEEKLVVRVGGSTPIATQARVIAATNQNLAELVRARRFREDLYFRLNVVTLDLPPLRERGDDVLLLAEHFLQHFSALARRKPPKFTAQARKQLLAHSWPGNVRELRNLMERLAYLAPEDQDRIDVQDLAFVLAPAGSAGAGLAADLPLAEATRQFQMQYIERRTERLHGNMTAVAESLGLHRSNLYRKMRQLGMDAAE